MTGEIVFSTSNNYVQKKEYIPENGGTVIETKNQNLFKQKNFILGIAVGAIFVSLVTAIVVVIIKLTTSTETSEWSYEHQDEWTGSCQTGSSQSPINLVESDALQSENLPSFLLENIDDSSEIEVENTGHTVSVKLSAESDQLPKLTGAGLSGNFTLSNIHFHWPSEHTINDKYYDLEAHMVFYNEEYDSLDDAILYPNAVTVIGVLFKETLEENVTSHENFDVIDKAVQLVSRKAGYSASASGEIIVSDFFPEDVDTYFQYTGSLTTPECNENVNWIVFATPSFIYYEDLEDLAKIYTEESERLKFNNRDLQSLNNRTVYFHTES